MGRQVNDFVNMSREESLNLCEKHSCERAAAARTPACLCAGLPPHRHTRRSGRLLHVSRFTSLLALRDCEPHARQISWRVRRPSLAGKVSDWCVRAERVKRRFRKLPKARVLIL